MLQFFNAQSYEIEDVIFQSQQCQQQAVLKWHSLSVEFCLLRKERDRDKKCVPDMMA